MKHKAIVLSLLLSLLPAVASTAPAWKPYHAAAGLRVQVPPGWHASGQGMEVQVVSPDGNSRALVKAFQHQPDENATTRLSRFPEDVGKVFPQAVIENIQPAADGQQILGWFTFQTPAGPSRGRFLCVWNQERAVYFAVGAPAARVAQDAPTLLKVLSSVAIDPPGRAKASKAHTKGVASVAQPPAPGKYRAFQDPREHAFTVQVPVGWKADGGIFRAGATDARAQVVLTSPDDDVMVRVGDARMPALFDPPNRVTNFSGLREGQTFSANGNFQQVVMRYLPALQFNQWYIQTYMTMLQNVQLIDQQPLPQIAARMSDTPRSHAMRASYDCGETTMSATLRGRKVHVVLHSDIMRSAAGTGWCPSVWVVSCADDAQLAAHMRAALGALEHMESTIRYDQRWQQGESAKGEAANSATRAQAAQTINNIQNTHGARYDSTGVMGRYWNHVAADNQRQSNFCDYIGDRQRVVNPTTGQVGKVSSGYQSNYQGRDGTVLQTNSPYSPGVDFTQLQNF